MAGIVESIASKVAEYLVAPVGRQCGYVIFSTSYVRELKEELDQLENAGQRVWHSVDEARNNMKPIEADVEEWMKKVDTVTNKAHGVLNNVERAKKTCFSGLLPNPKERYCLGRNARKTVQAIQELILHGKFERVSYESAPPGHVASPPDVNSSARDLGDTITNSRASIFQGIMKALDDEKLKVIGVYGPGGVGKSTLLKEVQEKLRKEKRPFQMIIKAEVSRTPDLNNIQGQIADALSLNLKDKQSQQGRRDLLFERLKKDPNEKVLIILDDLWEELDLEAVGIPLGEESTKCKLLLTSRDQRVLQQRMHADLTFHLQGLSEDEAFRLFKEKVGNKLEDDVEFKQKAEPVVRKLAGLPLLITSVASTLKCSGVETWSNMLKKIEDPNTERIVKWSYNHLTKEKEDAKSIFLLCGLIGGTIKVELLLGLGMGLGLFVRFNETIKSSRDRLSDMLGSLRSACLLQDGGDDKENVTIHDLYSEEVVSTPFEGQNSLIMNNNSWSEDKLGKCWAICLTDVGSDRLAKLIRCGFPDLKILMLSQPKNWSGRPAHRHVGDCCRLDFTYMKQLRVLYIRFMHIPTLPSSIEILENLRSLYLEGCDVNDVAILGKLKALQILSFAGSLIYKLPKEIGDLTNLKSLNLSHCWMLAIIEPGVLKRLINLEELLMHGSSYGWMGNDEVPSESCNAKLAELKSLTKLSALEISIPDPTILLEDGDLPFGNLIRFWINIGKAGGREFKGLRTMKIKLKGCDGILSKEWIQKTLYKTQHLHLDGLREFKKSAHELCTQGFPQLKHLDIDNSPSIEYIANSSNGLPPTAVMKLESLFLKKLINLEKIWNGPVPPDCFSKLKDVTIVNCHRLKNLVFLSEKQTLVHLEEIQVRQCNSLQAIITYDAGKVEVVLPNVRLLDLRYLPNMTSFCTRAEGAPIQVSFPLLESVEMIGLLDLEKILYSQPPLQYTNLKSIEIRKSRSTSSILKSDWMLSLPNLESLEIIDCQSTKVVFHLDELKVTGQVEILPQLTKLTLSELPDLQHLWKHDVKLRGLSAFRNLKELNVYDTGLAFLFPVSVAKCLGEITSIEVTNCRNMGAVIVDKEGRDEGTDDIIEFPKLKRLSILDCPMKKFFSCPSGKKEFVTSTSDSQDGYSDSFFDRKVCLPSLEELTLFNVGSLKRIWHGELHRTYFCELATLTLYNCSELLNVFPSTITGRLHNLKAVEVSKCPSLESLFDYETLEANKEQTRVLLPKLEKVAVYSCPSLKWLLDCGSLGSNTEQTIVLLPKLEVSTVYGAEKLRHVVKSDSETVLDFPRLANVNCEQMKEVVPKEEGSRSKGVVMSLPSLTHIIIRGCRNLEAFNSSPTSVDRKLDKTAKENDESPQPLFSEMVILPKIRSLQIEGAQCKELWNNQILDDSFCELEFVRLKHCHNLQRVAPSHMWKRLHRSLDILQVESCRSIKIIYEGDDTVMKSGKLTRLVLRDLENLRHIWQSNGLPNVPFPSLRFIKVQSCPRLRMLFPTFTPDFLDQIEELAVESCEDMELIASHEECEEATGTAITFSELTALRLFELPKFRSFLPEKYSEEFPSLQVLSRVSCGTEPDQCLDHWEWYQRRSEFEIDREMERRF